MKKRILSVILTLTLCMGLSAPALAARTFTDVPSTYWAYDAIMRVSDDSKWPATFNGTSASTFSPEGKLTRGQFIAALNRSMNNEYWASLDGPAPYADVPESAYYYQAMIWAKQEGILPSWLINGKNIYPNTPLTRAEFCVILRNFDRWECGRSLDEMTDMYLDDILAYEPRDEAEAGDKAMFLEYLRLFPDTILTRENKIAHLTASGFVVSADGTKVLMAHHNIATLQEGEELLQGAPVPGGKHVGLRPPVVEEHAVLPGIEQLCRPPPEHLQHVQIQQLILVEIGQRGFVCLHVAPPSFPGTGAER